MLSEQGKESALHKAAQRAHKGVVKLLVKYNADMRLKDNVTYHYSN